MYIADAVSSYPPQEQAVGVPVLQLSKLPSLSPQASIVGGNPLPQPTQRLSPNKRKKQILQEVQEHWRGNGLSSIFPFRHAQKTMVGPPIVPLPPAYGNPGTQLSPRGQYPYGLHSERESRPIVRM